jgi:MoaA/NifB/PqqE/SkfB family radical SAM enzyme
VRRHRRQKLIHRGDGVAPPLPQFVVYEPTLLCNLHCSFCYIADILNPEDWRNRELTLEELDRIFGNGAVKAFNITGGEPFVRKNLISIFELFQSKGMRCDYITTNGTVMTEDKAVALAELTRSRFLKHISVSLDGPEAFHDEIRGMKGAFKKAAANIERLRRAFADRGLKLPLSINTTLTAGNLELLPQVVDAAAEWNVELVGLNQLMFATEKEVRETLEILGETDPGIISTHVTDDPGMNPKAMPQILRESLDYAAKKGVTMSWRPAQTFEHLEKYYTPNEPLEGRCFYPFFGGRITYDGKVHFCPFIRVEVGDLRKESLKEVWNKPKYVAMRKKLLDHGIFPVCRRCCKVELASTVTSQR